MIAKNGNPRQTVVPITRSLEANLSLRYDDYSDFGETVNPKIAVRYQPLESLVLRGSYNTGFRAPTLYDLYTTEALVFSRQRSSDPVLCPGGVPNLAAGAVRTRDCIALQNLATHGNLELDPNTMQIVASTVTSPIGLSSAFVGVPADPYLFGLELRFQGTVLQSIGAPGFTNAVYEMVLR